MRCLILLIKNDLKKILGSKHVIDEPEVLKGYASDYSYVMPRMPGLVIRPKNASEIVKVVQLARENGLRLVPVSSGAPRFRGDTVPAVEDAVIVDLGRMKKIIWVNRRNRVALVEPGVTFGRLQSTLEGMGLRCMFPLLPKAKKSVVGAFMEREPFTIPKYAWDLGDPVASSELILGDGYCMRTGGGAGPGRTLRDQHKVGGAQKFPLSPLLMDVRRIAQGSQGSYGICSWLSLRCELLPEHEKVFFAASDRIEDLTEAYYRLMYLRLTDEMYILNNLNFAALLEKDPLKIIALQQKLPSWIMVMSIGGYGELAGEQFEYKDADIHEEADKLGIRLLDEIGGVKEAHYRSNVLRRVSDEPYWKTRLKGDCREIFFLTSLSKTPDFIRIAKETAASHGYDSSTMGIYLQMVIQGTACHCEFDLYTSPGEASSMEGFYNELSRKIFAQGGYYSRPYGIWSDLVYPHSETFVKYARGLKKIFDPDTVMNPGKLCFKEVKDEPR